MNEAAGKKKYKKPRVIDLFSGCGGLSFGFKKQGFEVVAGIDNWPDSLKTFEYNHPGSKGVEMDLSNFDPKSLDKFGKIDVVIGGPPCQGFSISGKRNPADPRNKLYQSFVACVKHCKPKAFVMENVPNLVSMQGGRVKDSILEEFTFLGYKTVFKILLASNYGVPQNRKRVFFVGLKNGEEFLFPEPTHGESIGLQKKVTCLDALSDLPENDVADGAPYRIQAKSDYQKRLRNEKLGIYNHETIKHSEKTREIISLVPDGGNYKDLPRYLQGTRKVNIAWTRFASNKPSLTIDTGHNHHFHYKWNRVPTARESARLQSFDDSFIFLGNKNQQIKQIGNAVPPMLAEVVAKALLNYI